MASGEKLKLVEDELSFSTTGMRAHKSTKRHRAPGLLLAFVAALCVLASPVGPMGSWSSALATVASILHTSPSTLLHLRDTQSTTATNLTGNGRTTDVLWDKYSLVIKGQRVFIHSGEFHTFRLPVPDLWLDILQKVKAAGFNAISVYTHMGLINPSPGVVDFNDYRALKPLYEAAKHVGVWIVLRPGPYINAETTAGGIAHWVTSQVAGELRTNATDWNAAWQDYIHGIITETIPYQIDHGGPVIDNEYTQSPATHAAYFQELEDVYHNSGIVVPLTANDPVEGQNWINGTVMTSDVIRLDSYPQGFDCSNPTVWSPVVTNYYSYHESVDPGQPWYFPEFQGGSFDAWGPTAPGYEQCRELTGPDFESVFYLNLWASNAKLINYYMLYGGTSWSALPFPGVYTSYDYGGAIAEDRQLTTKYPELKRQGLFLRSSPEFYKTDHVGDTTTSAVTTTSPFVHVTMLRNPDTGTSFYIARHNDSTSMSTINFKMNITIESEAIQVPRVASAITLSGRQSKIIVTDYSFGSSKVWYATAQVLYTGRIGSRDVLYLYGDPLQEHEVALALNGTPRIRAQSSSFQWNTLKGITTVSLLTGIEGLVTLWDSDQQLVLYSDTATAGTFWSPEIPSNDGGDFASYWQFGTNASILVGGPYLVRNATMVGSKLELRGDLDEGVRLTVIAPDNVRMVTWNGFPVSPDVNAASTITTVGGFSADLSPSLSGLGLGLPKLSNWKYADSLPEIQGNFSDVNWTIANHTSTNIPFKPYYGDGRVLYGCDYEFCENIVLWHGHFNATEETKSVNLSINGGEAFAASVWVNDVFLKTSYGNSTNNKNVVAETDEVFYFPPGSLKYGEDNVITVVQDNMGLDENGEDHVDDEKSPRGIRGFMLNAGNFNEWKVQGKLGGYTNFPDKVRGVLNEGGLYGERQGWHLPGFNTSLWMARDLSEGLPSSSAGVGIPEDFDVPISFTFDGSTQPYRALLFVNGWMMGKRVANLGPQYDFPVHQGILDYNGINTVVVALWAMESIPISPTLKLTAKAVYEGGVGKIHTNNPAWSAR
ncbi:glycoside hydrolase family 35 protein [Pisolithus orientalis]|uniref:glycoside hydrolase family 35 protein n=1 Tax=Pisolithus orientalis TaxID=936130 RepID=UPI0022257763|nr:glycoside hydrolase family 35 protein [Pisolithus orientalis]KAI6030502.1 glycoside hydrolase family 35 protein [Pisolithus orientalis]